MRIDSISPNLALQCAKNLRQTNIPTKNTQTVNSGVSFISFMGGNKGDVLHFIAEVEPSFKTGGVATVGKDYKTLNNISKNEHGRTVIFTPYYNGNIQYDKESGEMITGISEHRIPDKLPDSFPQNHPLRGKEGRPFMTTEDLSKKSIIDVLKENKILLLEEVKESEMEWGRQEKAPIKLFHLAKEQAKCPENTDIFFIYTDATASMRKPYEGGGYASTTDALTKSWNGDPYAMFSKAGVKLMPSVEKKLPGYDPATVICSDSQTAFVSHYMAQENASKNPYYIGKKPTQVGHNLGDGYIGKTSARNMLVDLGASKKQIETIINSKEYMEALLEGREDEFLMKFIKGDLVRNKKSAVSAMHVPIYYAKKGFLPKLSTVSEGYQKATITNRELVPLLFDDLVELAKDKKYIGLTNALNDPDISPFVQVGLKGYGEKQIGKLADGTYIEIEPLKVFDKQKSENLEYVREIKRQNKINLFKRMQKELDGLQLCTKNTNAEPKQAIETSKNFMSAEESENLIRAGLTNKSHELIGGISKDYISALEKGEDVKLIVSWGRGDFQKALDTVVDAFEKFVNTTGDDKSVLILGGDLEISKNEGDKVINKVKLLAQQEKFKGRVLLMNGFAPGLPFATAADLAVFPSRFAPCELTDLETFHKLCTTVVTDCQGLGQKNFDPDRAEEAIKKNGYKTQHEFYTSPEKCLESDKGNQKLKSELQKLKSKLEKEEKTKFKLRTGRDITKEELQKRVFANEKFERLLRDFRDSIIADELADGMNRALIIHRNDSVAREILKNHINLDTTWENNGWLSATGKSSAQLYREEHIQAPAVNIESKNLLGINNDEIQKLLKAAKKGNDTETSSIIKKPWFKTKNGKLALGIAAGAAIVSGLSYLGYKKGWFSSSTRQAAKKSTNNLSAIA